MRGRMQHWTLMLSDLKQVNIKILFKYKKIEEEI